MKSGILKAFLFITLMIPMEAHVSGKQQASMSSNFYQIMLSGGISSWDYDTVRARDKSLEAALLTIKPELDKNFSWLVTELNLNHLVTHYRSDAQHIHGVMIEQNEEKEIHSAAYFMQHKNSSKNGLFSAAHKKFIPETSFELYIQVTTTGRIKFKDLDAILDTQIQTIKNSPKIIQLIY